MAIRGIFRLFSGSPLHPVGNDGRMALSDHLRELRARILKVALAIVVALVVALFFFDPLFDFVYGPYQDAARGLGEDRTSLITQGPAGGLMLYLKLCGFAALIGTAPIWLYQIWAFIMPGLHAHEKKMTGIFLAVSIPLFGVGLVLGYITLAKGLEVLIGLNPAGVDNLVEFAEYLQFFTRTLLVFGLGFQIPVFVIMLNRAGVVSGASLGRYRPWIIIAIFVFAAVATPSTDPFTMTFMAVPMVLLFFLSEAIARVHDRRKAARSPNAGLSPDEMSPLP